MSFNVEVGVRQGCVMSPWLFSIYMNGCIREMKVGVQDFGARLNVRGVEQPVVAGLYADDTVLLAESEGMLQRIVHEFDRVCKRRKLKVNADTSKVMVFVICFFFHIFLSSCSSSHSSSFCSSFSCFVFPVSFFILFLSLSSFSFSSMTSSYSFLLLHRFLHHCLLPPPPSTDLFHSTFF